MAQLNDLLVLGYTNLLGTVNVFGEILADTFNGKFKGNGSLITNINAENISSGTLPVSRGGTGLASVTANSILAGNGSSSFKSIGTASGALYATSAGGAAQFGTLPVAQGGSGATTFTSNAVLTGNGTGAFKAVASAPGALYATAANGAPVFGTLPVAQGGTGRTSWTAYSLVYASAAGALSSLSTGTSGYVLQSGGKSAAPSWINATNASTANTIVKRDANGGFSAGVIEAKVKKIAINGIDTATEYGDYGGIIQSSSDGPNSSAWHNSIKILHTNAGDHYYTQLAQQFTGKHGLWHRSMRGGELSSWYKVMDIVNGESAGSATKPIYINAGEWAECSTYAGGSRVKLNGTEYPGSTATFYAPTSAGTSGQVLISSGGAPSWSGIAAVKKTTAAIEGDRTAAGDISALYLYGQTYGNTASNLAAAGKMSYGDPGPQIIFNTGNISSPGSQAAALIFTDHDTIAAGTSLSLVSNQGNVSFIAPTIKALTKFIGTLDGNASSATKLANARTINGTSFNGTANITTLNWGTARDITIGNTKRSVNGSQAYSWSATEIGYRHEWTASVKGVTWSRLCHVAAGSGVVGSKFILFIGATRGNVVYNDAYLITAHHSENGRIVKIAGHDYSAGYKIRLLANANGDCYIELWDNCHNATASMTQGVSCRLIPIFTGAITRYTTFTTGATLPSGYKEKQVVTLDNADIQAASINPTAHGTGNIGSNSNKWNAMYANTFNGVATQINVNNTTPTSETKFYPLYVNDVSGGQQVKANADFYYYDSGTWSSLNVGNGTNKGILSLHNSNKYVNLDPAALTANRSITIRDMDGYLGLATQYEYNKELAMGSTGKVCIGKFPMYDSNVTVRISSTTNTTYNGTLVIATQNINTSGGGSYKAVVYGDEYNNLTSSIKIHYGSGSNVFSVYIDLPGWSKNLVHVQCVGLAGAPTDVLTSVSSIPSTATITPTHVLSTSTHVNSANSATTASKLNVSAGSAGQAIYFSGGQPAAIDWRIGNKDVGEHNANNVAYNFSGYYTSNGPATTLGAQTNDGSLWAQAYNETWVTQIAQDYRDGQLFVRSKNSGTWQAWKAIPMLTAKSVGSNTQPVYVNDSGVITACTAYSGLFTGMSWSNRELSLTIGGTTKAAKIPTNLSEFNRISFTTTDNTNSPTGQSIVLNGVTNSTDTTKSPGIGFHVGNKSWGSLRFNYDGTFHFYDNACTGHMSVYTGNLYPSGNIYIPNNVGIVQTQNSGSNYTTPIKWLQGGVSEATYDPQIGHHNTGDTDGAIILLPYSTSANPWNANDGLYISKTRLLWNSKTILHSSNYNSYAPTKTGGGASGTWGISITGNAGTATSAKAISSTGYGDGTFTWYQGDGAFAGRTGWASYLISNHGDGSTYYHQIIAMPFWGAPCYRRMEGSTSNTKGWYDFITDENYAVKLDGRYVNVSGDTMTGNLTVPSIYASNWFRSTGNNGWYNETHGGGIYMQDSTYVRTYNDKSFYVSNAGQHAIYTAGGFASAKTNGAVLSTYYNNTWYGDTIQTHGNGNLSISAPGGNLYLAYARGLTYFGGSTYCIDRGGYFNGTSAVANQLPTSITFADASSPWTPAAIYSSIGSGGRIKKASWDYSGNGYVAKGNTATTQCPFFAIDLAGTTVIQAANSSTVYTQIYITAPTTSGVSGAATNEMVFYNYHGDTYSPAWTRVLTHRNYNSYAPKLDGTGASGTWGISISGNAATASQLTPITNGDLASSSATWRRIWMCWSDNTTGRPAYDDRFAIQTSTGTLKAPVFSGSLNGNASSASLLLANSTSLTSTTVDSALESSPSLKINKGDNSIYNNNDGLILTASWSSSYGAQVWLDDGGGEGGMAIRNRKSGGWNPWRQVITSANIGSQTVNKATYSTLWALTGTANTTTGHSDWDGGVGNTNKYTVYDQEWACSSIGTDTGDLRVFLRPGEYTSGGTEVCFAIDGDYYVMGHKVLHAGNWSSYITGTDNKVKQSETTVNSYRPVLLHYNYADYGTLPTNATEQVYANAKVAVNPSTGELKASLLRTTSYMYADTYVRAATYVRAGSYLRSGNYGTGAPTSSTAGATTAGALYFQIVS